MDPFKFCQSKNEYFHEYFIRVQDYFDELETWGYYYGKWELCQCILEGMNSETQNLAEYMSNGRLPYMGLEECWDFLCFMSNQSVQVELATPKSEPIETSKTSLEAMIKDLTERINENMITERCQICSSSFHSTTSCPFDVREREGEVALGPYPLALNHYVHDDEESTAPESGYDDSLDFKCESSPLVLMEDNAEESSTVPEPIEVDELNVSFPVWDHEIEYSAALNEDEYFVENESFFGDDEVCPEFPCIPCTEFSFSITHNLLDENPNSELNGEFREFILGESGKFGEYLDPFEKYFEKLPFELNCYYYIPSHEDCAKTFDKLKRCMSAILFNFDLSLYYICFCEMCSKEFDRLLRALTMSDRIGWVKLMTLNKRFLGGNPSFSLKFSFVFLRIVLFSVCFCVFWFVFVFV